MDSNRNSAVSRPLTIAVAAALVTTLAACGEKPVTSRSESASNRSMQIGARQAAAPLAAPTQQTEQAPRVNEKSAPTTKGVEDEVLTAKVKSALIAEQTLSKSLGIDVAAAGGTVILKGVADSNSDREKAVQIASSVAGVRSVRNDLVVISGS